MGSGRPCRRLRVVLLMKGFSTAFRASIWCRSKIVTAGWACEALLLQPSLPFVFKALIDIDYPGFQAHAEHDDQIEQCQHEAGRMGIGPGAFAVVAGPQLWETDPSRQQCNGRQPFKETRMGPDAHGEPVEIRPIPE